MQEELSAALTASENFTFKEREDATRPIGYEEPEIEKSTMIFEKHTDYDVYILLKLQPHENYGNISRVLIQVFDKETGALISELDNILSWKED